MSSEVSINHERKTRPPGSAEPIRLHIEGMTCGGCVARVERAIQAVKGVARAQVNLSTETATVEPRDPAPSRNELIRAVRQIGYDAEVYRPADNETTSQDQTQKAKLQRQKQTLIQAVALSAPIVGLHWLAPALQSSESGGHVWPHALQALLTLVLLGSSAGAPILVGGLRAILHRTPNMDLLIALGTGVAFVSGVASVLAGHGDRAEFHAAAMILAFINVGRYLELRARRSATSAVSVLARSLPTTAQRVNDNGIEKVAVSALLPGDRVRVAQDMTIPVDGVIVEGEAAVDESSLTGESMPQWRKAGEEVASGTMVREGMVTLSATRLGAESTIARVLRAVEEAQAGKTRMQRIADQVAGVFVPIVMGVSLVTLVGTHWLASIGWPDAIQRAVAVLVIACPCAMGLATPTVVLVATGAAARRGILVREVAALEATARVDVVLLDKTGTLTTGRPQVTSVFAIPNPIMRDATPREINQWAAAAEQYSQHPLARAIVDYAHAHGFEVIDADTFENHVGRGVQAEVLGRVVLCGNAEWLAEMGIDLDEGSNPIRQLSDEGLSVVLVAVDGHCIGAIGLADPPKPNAAQAIKQLRELGVAPAMVTGDHVRTASAVARALDLTEVRAGMSIERKRQEVDRLRAAGHRVAFVGDGINDATALATADAGITFASATDVAIGAADLTILHDDLLRIPQAIRLARQSVRIIKQNLFWAFFYNFAAIPVAASGLITPGIAAAAMALSSISVVMNSLRLRSWGDVPADRVH